MTTKLSGTVLEFQDQTIQKTVSEFANTAHTKHRSENRNHIAVNSQLGYDNSPKNITVPYCTVMEYCTTNNMLYVVRGPGTKCYRINCTTNSLVESAGISCGEYPSDIVYCPTNDKLYISNQTTSGTVTVIRASDSVATTISGVGSNPEAIVYCPSNDSVYVAGYSSNTIIVIKNDIVVATLTMPDANSAPRSIEYCPATDTVIVGGWNSSKVYEINPHTNTFGSSIAVGTNPHYIRYCPSSELLYIACYTGNTIDVINPVSMSLVKSILVSIKPMAIEYCPTNDRLYVGFETLQNTLIINPHSNILEHAITNINGAAHTTDICYVPTVDKLYYSYRDGNLVSVVDPKLNNVQKSHRFMASMGTFAGADLRKMCICPSTQELWVISHGASEYYVFDLNTNTYKAGITIPDATHYDIVYSDSTDSIYIVSGMSLYKINPHTYAVVQTKVLAQVCSSMIYCPYNGRIYTFSLNYAFMFNPSNIDNALATVVMTNNQFGRPLYVKETNRIYLTSANSNNVAEINPISNTILYNNVGLSATDISCYCSSLRAVIQHLPTGNYLSGFNVPLPSSGTPLRFDGFLNLGMIPTYSIEYHEKIDRIYIHGSSSIVYVIDPHSSVITSSFGIDATYVTRYSLYCEYNDLIYISSNGKVFVTTPVI